MERLAKIAKAHSDYINSYHKYKMLRWDKFDYSILSRNIMYYKKKGKFQKGTWNDVIIPEFDYVLVEKTLGKFGNRVEVFNDLPLRVQHLVGSGY